VRRRAFTVISALSLLLCLAIVVLWVRSYYAPESITLASAGESRSGEGSLWVTSTFGDLKFTRQTVGTVGAWKLVPLRVFRPQFPRNREWDKDAHSDPWHRASFLGFSVDRLEYPPPPYRELTQRVIVPYFALATLAGFEPAILLLMAARRMRSAARGRKRNKVGHCPTCGYDITGNTSGTCPECGNSRPRARNP
jgi:hypothetical protein